MDRRERDENRAIDAERAEEGARRWRQSTGRPATERDNLVEACEILREARREVGFGPLATDEQRIAFVILDHAEDMLMAEVEGIDANCVSREEAIKDVYYMR